MPEAEKSGGGYFSGFMMGALIGAAAVFFFGTKKGKRVATLMQQEGVGGLKDLKKLAAEIEVKGETFAKEAQKVTKELEKKAQSGKKELTSKARKQLSYIKKLQAKGRAAAAHYFKIGEIHPD